MLHGINTSNFAYCVGMITIDCTKTKRKQAKPFKETETMKISMLPSVLPIVVLIGAVNADWTNPRSNLRSSNQISWQDDTRMANIPSACPSYQTKIADGTCEWKVCTGWDCTLEEYESCNPEFVQCKDNMYCNALVADPVCITSKPGTVLAPCQTHRSHEECPFDGGFCMHGTCKTYPSHPCSEPQHCGSGKCIWGKCGYPGE